MVSALSNRQNCACAHKTLQTQRGRTHGAGYVRQWFRAAEPLGERRYENWNTNTHTHTHTHTSELSTLSLRRWTRTKDRIYAEYDRIVGETLLNFKCARAAMQNFYLLKWSSVRHQSQLQKAFFPDCNFKIFRFC